MIKNTKIDLSPESQNRIDAINSIKYTLLLNYEVPEIKDDTDDVEWVEQILERCRKCCKDLFGDYGERELRNKFFGDFDSKPIKTKENEAEFSLKHMDEEGYTTINQTSAVNMYDMLLHQCIISAYHAIVTALIGDETVSFYEIVEKIKVHKAEGYKQDSRGIHYLVKKKKYSLKNSEIKKRIKPITEKQERWSNSGSFEKKTKTHLKKLLKYKELFVRSVMKQAVKEDVMENRISLQFSDLWCRICEVNATDWDFEGDNTEWLKKIGRIDQNLLKKKSKDDDELDLSKVMSDKTDGLYAFYLAERLFNINLFYSVLEFVEFIEKTEGYDLSKKHMLKTLLECKKMPNAFSRQCFLGYAIGKIITQPESNIDYWFDKDIKNVEVPIRYLDSIETGFQIASWIKQFYRFVNYMSEFIIPIYQWCFIGMLLESIEKVYSEDTYEKALTKEEIHKNHLIKAFELLASYMDKHAVEMIRPISIDIEKTPFRTENLSVLIKHRYEKEYNLSKDVIAQIAETFLIPNDEEDIELNFKIINPEYFRNSPVHSIGHNTNFSKIQKFYTGLIKHTYLKK